MVVAFHYFVDLCTDAGVKYNGEPAKLSSYEQAAASFIFFNFLLSMAATAFAVSVGLILVFGRCPLPHLMWLSLGKCTIAWVVWPQGEARIGC